MRPGLFIHSLCLWQLLNRNNELYGTKNGVIWTRDKGLYPDEQEE